MGGKGFSKVVAVFQVWSSLRHCSTSSVVSENFVYSCQYSSQHVKICGGGRGGGGGFNTHLFGFESAIRLVLTREVAMIEPALKKKFYISLSQGWVKSNNHRVIYLENLIELLDAFTTRAKRC